MSSQALDEVRSKMADTGGTLGEVLVASGVLADDALTDFYKQRLLVPQVNPNTLARLPARVVAVIPSDMAIELRAIPVSLDNDNNLTVAMSDPSDRHAVDEISFFTGAYVVRAVATQMQIAWCLAHYYGHVTSLGQRLLQPNASVPKERIQAAVRPRPRGMTGEVDAMRHRGIVPGQAVAAPAAEAERKDAKSTRDTEVQDVVSPEDGEATDPQKGQRARTASGEIKIVHRAPSIKPPIADDDDDSGPVIVMEPDDPSGPARMPLEDDTVRAMALPPVRRKRPAEPDPPELAARAGEVDLKSYDRDIGEGPSVVIDQLLEQEAIPQHVTPSVAESISVSGEFKIRAHSEPAQSNISVEVSDEESAPVMIREAPRAVEEAPSAPILLDRKRPSDPPPRAKSDSDVVVLANKKAPQKRGDRRTAMGVGVVGTPRAAPRDTEQAPPAYDDVVTGRRTIDLASQELYAGEDSSSDELLAAPPSPLAGPDTSPIAIPPDPDQPPGPSGQIRLSGVMAAVSADGLDDDSLLPGRATLVMTASELDEVIPGRTAEVLPAHLDTKKPAAVTVDYDPLDDGWGPPGSTIPPPLLGAIPGFGASGDNDRTSGKIPIPNLDSQPLMVAPPSPPEHARPHTNTEVGVARALEQATERVLDLIRHLEQATERNQVVETMIGHLAENHRRAGFFALRGGELSLFSISPQVVMMPAATVRLDRPSTLADVVGTRLPYRGPMHDDTSRTFLQSVLGACPAEILLVPITVRERVVGVLFGEHRLRHTFDDQLALAARAAGNALERILKSKRG